MGCGGVNCKGNGYGFRFEACRTVFEKREQSFGRSPEEYGRPEEENFSGRFLVIVHSFFIPGMELYQDEEKEEIKRGNDQKRITAGRYRCRKIWKSC